MTRYFDVLADDKNFGNRWFLGEPFSEYGEQIDARLFRYGRPYSGPRPIRIPLSKSGNSVSFTLGAFDYPVIDETVKNALDSLDSNEYELFSVVVGDLDEPFWILNALHSLECVDESRSIALKWTVNDQRLDRIGTYRSIRKLRVDGNRVHKDLFRIRGWEVALIISDRVRNALKSIPNLGVSFLDVT